MRTARLEQASGCASRLDRHLERRVAGPRYIVKTRRVDRGVPRTASLDGRRSRVWRRRHEFCRALSGLLLGAAPLMSRRRPCLPNPPFRGQFFGSLSVKARRERHVATAQKWTHTAEVHRARPAPTPQHDLRSKGGVTMSRTSSATCVRGLKGGWGNGPATAPRS